MMVIEEKREKFFDDVKKYFALSEVETEKMIHDKFKKTEDKRRLFIMLETIYPYFDKFLDEADEKLKRKVGKVFFSKLDYSQFSDKESLEDMRDRLNVLFYQTSSKGINTYKILYNTVLTDGNLKRDSETWARYYDTTRDFDNIYDSLVTTLGLTAQEAKEIFEKCSSLIAKGYAYKFPHISNKMQELTVYDNYSGYRVFKRQEIVDILKINPSLFVTSTDRIQDAFDYIQRKMARKLDSAYKEVSKENPNLTFLEYRTIMLRKWLKNNSTLLVINSQNMYKKEKYLINVVAQFTSPTYSEQFRNYFQEPINLSILNQIPYSKIERNAIKNIKTLEVKSKKSQADIMKYLASNPYMIGMESSHFTLLLSEIERLDAETPEEKYFDKFFEFGKTLFASNIDFNIKAIVDKLKNNIVMQDIDVEDMSDKECLHKFIEIFFDGKFEAEFEIEDLIKAREARISNGEKSLRQAIRKTGQTIRYLPKILKDDYISKKEKREYVLSLANDIQELHDKRFLIAGRDVCHFNVTSTEKETSKKIEDMLNLLRNTYEQKRFKLGKKYANVDQLFEKTMDYLSSCFDDKEAITDLFRSEIVKPYDETIRTTFDTRPSIQQQLFGDSIVVENVGDLISPLRKLDEEVNKLDCTVDTTIFTFER